MIRQIKNILKFTLIISLVSLIILTPPVGAKRHRNDYNIADNFIFKSFTGDYYITRDENKLAKMHVIETLIAEFPDHNQNHGIKRVIPATSNGGKNIVISNPSKFQAKVKRNGSDEPYTTSFTDGYTFATKNLSRGEGMTFAIAFSENTFTPTPTRISYIAYFAFGGMTLAIIIAIFLIIRRYLKKIAPKRRFYKHLLTAPQFTPLKDYTIAEVASLYLKPAQNPKVASVIELAIRKKIEIIKIEDNKKKLFNKESWAIRIKDLKGLSKEQLTLLNIMDGGIKQLSQDQIIKLKTHSYNSTLSTLYNQFNTDIETSLRNKKDFEPETRFWDKINWRLILQLSTVGIVVFIIALVTVINQEWFINTFGEYSSVAVKENEVLLNIAFYMIPAFFLIISCGTAIGYRYIKYTNQGLEKANYLAGLELYIKMAETDRLRFLQSVEGADITNEGIVKLYEKLLPYAIIFGQEKSWRKSLERYYQLVDEKDITLPLYFSLSDSSFRSLNSSLSSSVNFPGSSGGSGFSGGFSGGGGGGGGGGGW